MKFEYRIFTPDNTGYYWANGKNFCSEVEWLDSLGEVGYELVQIEANTVGYAIQKKYYFKKQVG